MKNKRRAVFILLFLGSFLALVAAWNLPESALELSPDRP